MLRRANLLQFRIISLVVALVAVTAVATQASTDPTNEGKNDTSVTSQVDSEIESALCGATSYATTSFPPSPEVLAWTSEQVVVGTVAEELPPAWGNPIMTGAEEDFDGKSLRSIYTEYVIDVEDRIRGHEHDVIRTRIQGGTIGDCTIQSDSVKVAVGDRVLLFLSNQVEPQDDRLGPAYYLTHVKTGVWDFTDGQDVAPRLFLNAAGEHGPEAMGALEQFTYAWPDVRSSIRDSLRSGELPPGDSTQGVPIVPLDAAPVQDS